MKVPRPLDLAWRYGAWPLLHLGSACLALHLHRRGLGEANTVFLVTALVGAILLGAQLLAGRTRPGPDALGTDLLHLTLSNGLVTAGFKALAFGSILWIGARLEAGLGVGLWPERSPLLAQLALALVLGELGFTLLHRAAHRSEALWPWHAVHHSSAVLYPLAATRNHPVNTLASYLAQVLPALLLGAPGEVLLLLGLFTAVNGLLQHSDLGLRTGPLSWIFATPEVHRLHHSRDLDEGNRNFGSNLVLWDHLLGSYQAPRRRPEELGLADRELPGGYWRQLAVPLRWGREPAGPGIDP